MQKSTKTERFMTGVTVTIVFGLLVIFVAGLASKSLSPEILGKSKDLWAVTVVAGLGAIILALLVIRSKKAARIIPRVAILSLMTLALFEGTGYLVPNLWPVPVLLQTPSWLRESLPESAFDRDDFQVMGPDHLLEDSNLVFRHAPNMDVQRRQGEISYRKLTDQLGFANNDASLYQNADVIVTGDSFTMGTTVEFDESWPQQLAQSSGLRVLNLGTAGWDVFQYPRVLETYGTDVNPSHVFVTLIKQDLSQKHYRSTDDSVAVMVENPRWSTQGLKTNNYVYFAGDVIRSIFPFSVTTAEYLMEGRPSKCKFDLGGQSLSFSFSGITAFVGPGVTTFVDKVRDDLDRVRDYAEAKGAELHFIYLPFPERIYIPLLESATNLNGCSKSALSDYQSGKLDLDKFYNFYQDEYFSDPAARNSNLLVDATPYLQSFAQEGEQLAWTSDPHPNALGYSRIADFVATLIHN